MPYVDFITDDVLFGADSVLFGAAPTTTLSPTGNPTYPFTLFRGQITGIKATRIGPLLQLTIEATDYNRLWGLAPVGAPYGAGNGVVRPDGTILWIDPDGYEFGLIYAGAEDLDSRVFAHFVVSYWPGGVDGVLEAHDINPTYFNHGLDWRTAGTTLNAVLDEFIAGQGPYGAYWKDADKVYHYQSLAPMGEVPEYVLEAPFALDMDGPWDSTTIMPMSLAAGLDQSRVRRRVYTRGGTVPSSLFFEDSDKPYRAGTSYIDAPGAVEAQQSQAIALWHLANNFRTFTTGSAHIQSRKDGWRVGQSVSITDAVLSELTGMDLAQTPAIISQVEGRLVSPGPGLTINITGVSDISALITKWQSFQFTEVGFGQPGKCNLTVEVILEGGSITFDDLAEINITTDGTAEIEYDIEWGDPNVGSLAQQAERAEAELSVPTRPVYRFIVTIEDPTGPWDNPGTAYMVVAQLVDEADNPVALAGVILEWLVLEWADDAQTVPGVGFALTDPVDTTDTNGRAYNEITYTEAGATSINYQVEALALPVD